MPKEDYGFLFKVLGGKDYAILEQMIRDHAEGPFWGNNRADDSLRIAKKLKMKKLQRDIKSDFEL